RMRRRLGPSGTAHGRDIVPILARRTVVETRRSGQMRWWTDVPAEMSIPGFVTVASVDRADELPEDDIDRFATAYEAICGRAAQRPALLLDLRARAREAPCGSSRRSGPLRLSAHGLPLRHAHELAGGGAPRSRSPGAPRARPSPRRALLGARA